MLTAAAAAGMCLAALHELEGLISSNRAVAVATAGCPGQRCELQRLMSHCYMMLQQNDRVVLQGLIAGWGVGAHHRVCCVAHHARECAVTLPAGTR